MAPNKPSKKMTAVVKLVCTLTISGGLSLMPAQARADGSSASAAVCNKDPNSEACLRALNQEIHGGSCTSAQTAYNEAKKSYEEACSNMNKRECQARIQACSGADENFANTVSEDDIEEADDEDSCDSMFPQECRTVLAAASMEEMRTEKKDLDSMKKDAQQLVEDRQQALLDYKKQSNEDDAAFQKKMQEKTREERDLMTDYQKQRLEKKIRETEEMQKARKALMDLNKDYLRLQSEAQTASLEVRNAERKVAMDCKKAAREEFQRQSAGPRRNLKGTTGLNRAKKYFKTLESSLASQCVKDNQTIIQGALEGAQVKMDALNSALMALMQQREEMERSLAEQTRLSAEADQQFYQEFLNSYQTLKQEMAQAQQEQSMKLANRLQEEQLLQRKMQQAEIELKNVGKEHQLTGKRYKCARRYGGRYSSSAAQERLDKIVGKGLGIFDDYVRSCESMNSACSSLGYSVACPSASSSSGGTASAQGSARGGSSSTQPPRAPTSGAPGRSQ